MKKTLLCLTLAIVFVCQSFAYDFESGGIYYNIIGNGEVEVARPNYNDTYYSGSIVIPSSVTYNSTTTYSVTSIGDSAFYFCTGLTSITIPNSVTSIGDGTFVGCGFTSITIPNSVTSIGDGAFYDCFSLTSITIPNSVTSIGLRAFCACNSLTSITIPNSVTSIGDYAFQGCNGLTSISVDANNTIYDSRNNCNAIIETATNRLISGCQTTVIPNSVTSIGDYAFFYCNGLTTITIPNSVTSIGDYAFYACSGLTSITIPNSVTSIGDSAFYFCTGLTSITIPNSVTSIGDGAFARCYFLTSVSIPNSVTSIGDYAFENCSSLTSITIPNSVTSIGDYAFYACSGLTSITIPNSVTSIGDMVFCNCHSLISITIPNSVTSIGDYAFYACSGLTSITIPNSVTSIGDYAFYACSGLTSVTIGNSVTSIGDVAFYGCSGLTEIICHAATPPAIESYTFSSYANVILYVPANSVTTYSGAAYWQNFFIQPIQGTKYSITGIANDNTMGTVLGSGTYDENDTAQLVAATKAGYSFIQWSDGNTDNPRNVVVTQDSTFTAEFAIGGGVNDTIYLEYDGKDAMQYALEEHGVYYFGGKVYNQQNLYIKLYYSDGKLLSSGTNDIDMSYYANGIYIVTDGKGGFLKINHYR